MFETIALPKLDSRVRHIDYHRHVGRLLTYNSKARTVTILMDNGDLQQIPYDCVELAHVSDRVEPIKVHVSERADPITYGIQEAYLASQAATRALKKLVDAELQKDFDEQVAFNKRIDKLMEEPDG